MKRFVPRMHEETYKELLARSQGNRAYGRSKIFEGILAGVAQKEFLRQQACEREAQPTGPSE